MEFLSHGGTEFACMSTTASPAIAARFAKTGANPMLFKYETKNCIERGADIAYLSVYKEQEVLYPPLTFLRFDKAVEEEIAGATLLVVYVEAQIVGN